MINFQVICDHCNTQYFAGGKSEIKQYDKKEADLCQACSKELADMTKRHDDEIKAFYKV